MIKSGIAASKGYAIGKVFIQEHEEIVINDNKISDIEAEKKFIESIITGFKRTVN